MLRQFATRREEGHTVAEYTFQHTCTCRALDRAPLFLQVAIKFLERGAGVNKSVLREILNHRLCVVHPNIVQFREVFLTPVHLAIVMEYAAGGDMFEYVIKHKLPHHGQGLVEPSARAFFQQLIIALEFCHELGIANRCVVLFACLPQ